MPQVFFGPFFRLLLWLWHFIFLIGILVVVSFLLFQFLLFSFLALFLLVSLPVVALNFLLNALEDLLGILSLDSLVHQQQHIHFCQFFLEEKPWKELFEDFLVLLQGAERLPRLLISQKMHEGEHAVQVPLQKLDAALGVLLRGGYVADSDQLAQLYETNLQFSTQKFMNFP